MLLKQSKLFGKLLKVCKNIMRMTDHYISIPQKKLIMELRKKRTVGHILKVNLTMIFIEQETE